MRVRSEAADAARDKILPIKKCNATSQNLRRYWLTFAATCVGEGDRYRPRLALVLPLSMRHACFATAPASPVGHARVAIPPAAMASRPVPCARAPMAGAGRSSSARLLGLSTTARSGVGGVARRAWRSVTPPAAHKSIGAVASMRGAFSTKAMKPVCSKERRTRPTTHTHRGTTAVKTFAIGKFFGGGSEGDSKDDTSVFASKKRSAVRIPGLVFQVTPGDVFDAQAMANIERVVAAGATAVVLADRNGGSSTRALFDAAVALKNALRGRCRLFIGDRADVAASAEADGVVVGDDGVPVVVARKSLPAGTGIVAVVVSTADAALVAAKEGADLIIATDLGICEEVSGKISVPVFASTEKGWDGLQETDTLVAAGAAGFFYADAPGNDVSEQSVKLALAAVGSKLKGANATNASVAGDLDAASKNRAVATPATPPNSSTKSGIAGKLIDGESLNLLQREREYVLGLSQIQAHCLMPLFDCLSTRPSLKGSILHTLQLGCLRIQYTHTVRLKTDPFPSQSQFTRRSGCVSSSRGTHAGGD
jgi:hypothetical protein